MENKGEHIREKKEYRKPSVLKHFEDGPTELCESTISNSKCPVFNCRYAHSGEELMAKECRYGIKCINKRCIYVHPGEGNNSSLPGNGTLLCLDTLTYEQLYKAARIRVIQRVCNNDCPHLVMKK